MKRSELKSKIEEIITELLDENVAYELTGTTGTTTQSFPNDSAAQQFKTKNQNIKAIKKI
jgi:hypothetical protein